MFTHPACLSEIGKASCNSRRLGHVQTLGKAIVQLQQPFLITKDAARSDRLAGGEISEHSDNWSRDASLGLGLDINLPGPTRIDISATLPHYYRMHLCRGSQTIVEHLGIALAGKARCTKGRHRLTGLTCTMSRKC